MSSSKHRKTAAQDPPAACAVARNGARLRKVPVTRCVARAFAASRFGSGKKASAPACRCARHAGDLTGWRQQYARAARAADSTPASTSYAGGTVYAHARPCRRGAPPDGEDDDGGRDAMKIMSIRQKIYYDDAPAILFSDDND